MSQIRKCHCITVMKRVSYPQKRKKNENKNKRKKEQKDKNFPSKKKIKEKKCGNRKGSFCM